MKILIICLLEILILADKTIGYGQNPSQNQNLKSNNNKKSVYPGDGYPNTTHVNKSSQDLVAKGVLDLGINIFKHTSADNKEKIQVISPLSIAVATALIQLGANGTTFEELLEIQGQKKS